MCMVFFIHNYHHGVSVCVSVCVFREINKAAGKQVSGLLEDSEGECMSFLYRYGATLNVEKPSVAVLSSGSISFSLNRPVCAFHHEVYVCVCECVSVCMPLCVRQQCFDYSYMYTHVHTCICRCIQTYAYMYLQLCCYAHV